MAKDESSDQSALVGKKVAYWVVSQHGTKYMYRVETLPLVGYLKTGTQRQLGTIMARILLIDDDEQILNVVTSLLEREHHEISTAVDGKQGIKLIENQNFDLIITDVIMPEMDGIEVLMYLLNQTNRPKVIAMSGGSASLDQTIYWNICKILRADKVLQKPLDFETLTSAVREVLEIRVAD